MSLRLGSLRKRAPPEPTISLCTETVHKDLIRSGMPVRITVQIDGHQPTVRFYSTGPFYPAIMQLKALKIRLVHSCRVCMAFGWFACAWHYAPVSQEVVEDIVGFIQHVPTLEVIEAEPVLCEQLARHPLRRIRLRAGE